MIDQLSKTNNTIDLFGEQVINLIENLLICSFFIILDFKKDSTRDNDFYK